MLLKQGNSKMELSIVSKEEKPLLSRTEVIVDITFEASTPKKEEIKKKISSMMKSDSSLVVVKKVYNIYGKKKSKVLAFVYTNEKDMKRIEPKPKTKKEGEKEKKEAPKESREEKPKEEKNESK